MPLLVYVEMVAVTYLRTVIARVTIGLAVEVRRYAAADSSPQEPGRARLRPRPKMSYAL